MKRSDVEAALAGLARALALSTFRGCMCVARQQDHASRDADAGVVLRETGHLTSAIDRHRQLADPAGQDALDVVLPQPEPVVVPGGKSLMSKGTPANPAT